MRRGAKWTAALTLAATLGSAPAYLRALTVAGPSDAPTLLLGDQVLVHLAAYDVRAPYSDTVLWPRDGPARGDMVLFCVPNRGGIAGLKRVAGLPGDVVEFRENAVIVNGQALAQEPLDRAAFAPWISAEHGLGELVLREDGRRWVTYTPGRSDLRTMPAVTVPPGRYYLLGDHRDNSNDSRVFGTLPRAAIKGLVMRHLRSTRPPEMLPSW